MVSTVSLVLFVVMLTTLTIATLRAPAIGLAFLIVLKPLDYWGQLSSPFLWENGRLTNIIAALVISIALLRAAARSTNHSGLVLEIGHVWVIWGYAALSLVWSPAKDLGLQLWVQYLPYMLLAGFVVPLCFKTLVDFQKAVSGIVWAGTLVAAFFVIFGQWQGRNAVALWSNTQMIWDPLAFGELGGYLMLSAVLYMRGRRAWKGLARLLVVVFAIALTIRSGSRGQFALMVGLSGLLFPLSVTRLNARTYLSVIGLLGFVTLVGFLAYLNYATDDQRWSSEHAVDDLWIRIDGAIAVMRAWWESPTAIIFGLGNSASFSPEILGFYPHVVPIEVLAEEGAVVFVLFVTLVVAAVRRIVRIRDLVRGHELHSRILATLASYFLFAFILSWKQGSLITVTTSIFGMAILLASLEKVIRLSSDNSSEPTVERRLGGAQREPDLLQIGERLANHKF